DNFAGTSLSNKWTTVKSAGGSVTVNNSATFAAAASSDYVFVDSATQAFPSVAESDMVSASANADPMLGVTTSTSTNSFVGLQNGYSVEDVSSTLKLISQTASGSLVTSQSESFHAGIWQMVWSATGSESASDGTVTLSGSRSTPSIANYGIYVGYANVAVGNSTADWGSMRVYPPNGVMPTTSCGYTGRFRSLAELPSVSDIYQS